MQIRSCVEQGPKILHSHITTGPPILRHCATGEAIAYNLISVLQVSRAFSMEALQIIYKTSLFCFRAADALCTFVDRVPERYLRIVGNFRVHLVNRTWSQNLSRFRLIMSCILESLPGLSNLFLAIKILEDVTLREPRLVCTIEKRVLSSTLLPQLLCAMVKLTAWSDPFEIETIEAWARRDMNDMRHLVAGQEREVEVEQEDGKQFDTTLRAASLKDMVRMCTECVQSGS